jgi:hypothetical protein
VVSRPNELASTVEPNVLTGAPVTPFAGADVPTPIDSASAGASSVDGPRSATDARSQRSVSIGLGLATGFLGPVLIGNPIGASGGPAAYQTYMLVLTGLLAFGVVALLLTAYLTYRFPRVTERLGAFAPFANFLLGAWLAGWFGIALAGYAGERHGWLPQVDCSNGNCDSGGA